MFLPRGLRNTSNIFNRLLLTFLNSFWFRSVLKLGQTPVTQMLLNENYNSFAYLHLCYYERIIIKLE